jgi:glucose/arabinose dehydrogenase
MINYSLFIIIPVLLLVLGVIFATFYHKYDTSRFVIPTGNLTVEILEGLGGNIISLQKDTSGEISSVVTGKWQFNKSAVAANDTGERSINFESTFTVYKADGKSNTKLDFSNFSLSNSSISKKLAVIDGNVTLNTKAKEIDGKTMPLHMVLSNNLILNMSSDSDLFRKIFENSPIYGKVTFSEDDSDASSNQTSVSRQPSRINTQIPTGPVTTDPKLGVELVTNQIKFPTKMAFLGNNDLLVLEKNEGAVKRVLNGKVENISLLDVPVANGVERGMLGIDINKTNRSLVHVFLYFTESMKDGDDVAEGKIPIGNRLYKYDLVDNKLVNPKLLLSLPAFPGSAHNGGVIIHDSNGHIYLSIGDLNRSNAKNSNSTMTVTQNNASGLKADGRAGILMMTEDGQTIEPGIIGTDDPLNKYFAYGIRNSFGMALDPLTGRLWDTESGPEFGDEINAVEPGFNSGWNKVQGIWTPIENSPGNITTDFSDLVSFNNTGRYRQPELSWYQPSPGLTGITFMNSTKLGGIYANDMLVGDFHNGNIYHFKLNSNRSGLNLPSPISDKVVNEVNETQGVIFAKGFGGITDIKIGPDGFVYVLSVYQSGDDCDPIHRPNQACIDYDKPIGGSLFRILPITSVN